MPYKIEGTKNYKELNYKERANIAKQRLIDPTAKKLVFCKEHGVSLNALEKIESLLSFDEDAAVSAIMSSILKKDEELIELSTDIKNKWAKNVSNKRTILNKDIDTLDKIENTAIKRQALMKAAQDAEKNDETLDISITL